ncbi:MAG: AzlD domain-containing protein [Thermoanaerobaculia bacterium]|nr:AzlD domain-containing protein [Thermoanaerobaculia bacterium]
MNPPSLGEIIAVAVGLGVATMTFRLVFGELRGRWSMPEGVRAGLGWAPVAALAAIIAPSLLPQTETEAVLPGLIAAVVSAAVAWRTRNLLLAVALGMTVFWLARGGL